MLLKVPSIVVSLSFVDLPEENDLYNWGSLCECIDLLELENPVEARCLLFLMENSAMDCENIESCLNYRAVRFMGLQTYLEV